VRTKRGQGFQPKSQPRFGNTPLLIAHACLVFLANTTFGCAPSPNNSEGASIAIGALLPFTGRESANGNNIEQAMLLAAEDINRAGGVGGFQIRIVSADSNSGGERGLQNLRSLLADLNIRIVVGPEENGLASSAVSAIKASNALNVLPGFTAPLINRFDKTGAWLRLAPNARQLGCMAGKFLINSGTNRANALISADDFNESLGTEFNSRFQVFGGVTVPSVIVDPNAAGFGDSLRNVFRFGAQKTALFAYPNTASRIVTDWGVSGRKGAWILSPSLRSQAFLDNIPAGSLDHTFGISATLSLTSECPPVPATTEPATVAEDNSITGMLCARDNAERFIRHFANRWHGTEPFPTAHFYYDAILLVALGIQYSLATDGVLPDARSLQATIRMLNDPQHEAVRWDNLEEALEAIGKGQHKRLKGAAAEYRFDSFGAAEYVTFDIWRIDGAAFVDEGAFYANCPSWQ
jgi:neutral amino acid transport system substrate-binding protein